MVAWAISVVGVVIITVLCDIILPEGETNKYIKTVIGIISVLVLASPLPQLFDGQFVSSNNSQNNQTAGNIQYEYLEFACEQRQEALQNKVSMYLDAKGYKNSQVIAKYTVNHETNKIEFETLEVKLDKSVINDGSSNIYIIEELHETLSKVFALNKERVTVYV